MVKMSSIYTVLHEKLKIKFEETTLLLRFTPRCWGSSIYAVSTLDISLTIIFVPLLRQLNDGITKKDGNFCYLLRWINSFARTYSESRHQFSLTISSVNI